MFIYAPRYERTEKAMQAFLRAEQDLCGCNTLATRIQLMEIGPDGKEGVVGVNKVNAENRTVSGTANAFEVSRTQLRLHIDGIQLAAFHENPIVLAGHEQISAGLMPGAIGTIEKMFKAEGNQRLKFRNMRFDQDAIADAWFQKVLSGTVRMTSVGFIPIDESFAVETTGRGDKKREMVVWDVKTSELVELSMIPIGANRGAFLGQSTDRLSGIEEQLQTLKSAMQALCDGSRQAESSRVLSRLDTALQGLKTL